MLSDPSFHFGWLHCLRILWHKQNLQCCTVWCCTALCCSVDFHFIAWQPSLCMCDVSLLFASSYAAVQTQMSVHRCPQKTLKSARTACRLGVLLAVLADFSLRHACRGTGESALEEFLWFGVVAALILARLQGHWGERFGGIFLDGFWQCQSCITIMGSKVDEVGPKMAPTQP